MATFKTAGRLITGRDALKELPSQLQRLGITHPFIVSDAGVVESGTLDLVTDLLTGQHDVFAEVPPEPEISVVEHCAKAYNDGQHDGVIAVGGGSAMDIAKVTAIIANHPGNLNDFVGVDKVPERTVPMVAIPTTAGTGSEVTNIAILSDNQEQMKKGIVSDYLLPDLALVAPEMTVSCPRGVTAASGVDALVHAIEAYLSNFATPITDALAIKAMKLIIRALPKAFAKPTDLQAREDMATGSLLAGLAFGNAGVGAVHALAYPLGGRYKMAHGVSNALMLPYVMEWNKLACVERFYDIAQALGEPVATLTYEQAADRVIERLHELCHDVQIPKGLRSFDIPESALPDLAVAASKVERLLKNNPRTLSVADIEAIYRAAY